MEINEDQISKTVLIVEDDKALADALRDAFSKEGYKTSVADDGQKGVDMAMQDHPSVIILDILLPRLDGLTALETISHSQTEPRSHVLLFSNLGDVSKIAQGLERGAEGYFIKAQTSMEEILNKVKELFERIAQDTMLKKSKQAPSNSHV